MSKWRLLLIIFILSIAIGVFHTLAIELNWYWIWRWFDIPMHILGGIIIALLAYFLLIALENPNPASWYAFVIMVGVTVVVGLGWELFELYFEVTFERTAGFDTLKDMVMDVIGAVIAWGVLMGDRRQQGHYPSPKHVSQ